MSKKRSLSFHKYDFAVGKSLLNPRKSYTIKNISEGASIVDGPIEVG